MAEIVDFSALRLTVAEPSDILAWSRGEVTKPETINYRTLKPEKDGLFDERIFGPTKDWECYCGKYKKIRFRGIICDKCGVEVTQARVRRERMGHINLAAPVAHAWFVRGSPSKLGLILDISPKNLDQIIYFAAYIVIEVDELGKKEAKEKILKKFSQDKAEVETVVNERIAQIEKAAKVKIENVTGKIKNLEDSELKLEQITLETKSAIAQVRANLAKELEKVTANFQNLSNLLSQVAAGALISEDDYFKLQDANCFEFAKLGMGAEAILQILEKLDLDKVSQEIKAEIGKSTGAKFIRLSKKLKLIEGLRKAQISPTSLILTVLPVLPPDLRPMVQLSGGRFATSDLNDLYRRVLNRNNRLKKLIDLGAPEIILRNEKRMLQEAVDSLIDSPQRPQARVGVHLRSLSDMLRGKQGRFRQNLLGKRVDYSGRSVIVVGPELRLTQAGIPREMALELFKPFVLKEVIARGLAPNVRSAKHILERRTAEVWDILEEITQNHPILLNRAPTLHRLGIQAFYPVLIEGDAIRIHPTVCAGYNADFDGDQMAVHVPLSEKAKDEAVNLMLSSKNLLRPADGTPLTIPNKEMALGLYYLTTIDDKLGAANKFFGDLDEAITAIGCGKLALRQQIKVRNNGKILDTTVGRIIFNQTLPPILPFYNQPVRASTIKNIVAQVSDLGDENQTAKLIDDLKFLGFQMATYSGLSVSLFDCKIIAEKQKIIEKAEKEITQVEKNVASGLITREEQRRLSNEIWVKTTEIIAAKTWENFGEDNSIRIISDSGGSRATGDQIKQIAGMRGLVSDPSGKIVPLPTKSNFREGLSVFEYFTSTRGARKGFADRALKTAESGYLTRRLIDVAHDVIIRLEDCGTADSIEISTKDARQTPFPIRLVGRIAAEKILDPKTKRVLVEANAEINEKAAELIDAAKLEKVLVRSPLTCAAKFGICAACYGRDLATKRPILVGTPVGVIAAQSIGEPGTQLTMRTFHLGGIVGLDITQGLPRVEELFEARTPKVLAPIAEVSGRVTLTETEAGIKVTIKSTGIKPPVTREYLVPKTAELKVENGQEVKAGTPLSSGHLDIREILTVRGLKLAQKYIIDGCQEVYEGQGVPINDKHFEAIVRKMSDKVRVESPGDTNLLPGELVDKIRLEDEQAKMVAAGGEPATAQRVILGITKAALYTESFLSAASFQETTNVLTDAAVEGKVDKLAGLKENVIIGRLIPTSAERTRID